jgi:hypothetical protein
MIKKPADQAWIDWFYNEHPGFGRVLADLGNAPKTTDTIFATGKTQAFERLADITALRRLSVRDISQAQLEVVASLTRLTELRVFGFRGADAGTLANLKKLECLSFEWAPKIATIGWLSELAKLRVLIIGDLKQIRDFAAIGALSQLRFLSISGGNETVQSMASVAPFAQLTRLEELQLVAHADADDLAPLAAMTWLKRLGIANLYPVQTYAHLAANLTRTECASFKATQRFAMGGARYVTLTGKPFRQFKAGDPKGVALIAKREAEFNQWLAHYRAIRRA